MKKLFSGGGGRIRFKVLYFINIFDCFYKLDGFICNPMQASVSGLSGSVLSNEKIMFYDE